jgi:divalent metal cation (Fe/Co/Zn/Cd) transporter
MKMQFPACPARPGSEIDKDEFQEKKPLLSDWMRTEEPEGRYAAKVTMPQQRSDLVERALWLEWLTATWMLIEAGVAIGLGMVAHSLTLIAFGADSIIELMSAALLLRHLKVELRLGEEFPQEIGERAGKISAALLMVLSLYVIVSAAWTLRQGKGKEFSLPGLALAIIALPTMYGLAKAKAGLAEVLRSGPMRSSRLPVAISPPL